MTEKERAKFEAEKIKASQQRFAAGLGLSALGKDGRGK